MNIVLNESWPTAQELKYLEFCVCAVITYHHRERLAAGNSFELTLQMPVPLEGANSYDVVAKTWDTTTVSIKALLKAICVAQKVHGWTILVGEEKEAALAVIYTALYKRACLYGTWNEKGRLTAWVELDELDDAHMFVIAQSCKVLEDDDMDEDFERDVALQGIIFKFSQRRMRTNKESRKKVAAPANALVSATAAPSAGAATATAPATQLSSSPAAPAPAPATDA
eukprot:655337-Pleurochrysis_carterae.AAC.1